MKTITLLASMVLMSGTALAMAPTSNPFTETHNNRFSFEEPITFMERGIEFFVFPNGDFDFNTRPDDVAGSYYFRKANTKETARGARPVNYGVLIEFDSFGRVRRVGNTFINYDSRDRVNRIGSVFMNYNRFALTQIGGLRIIYNRFGEIVDMVGSVKRNGFTNNYYGNNHNTYYGENYNTGNAYNDNNYYYYRGDGSKERVTEETTRKEEEKK
ncbi:MAG: hypothetical protein RLZZ500_1776 [Bacteroidota bacterium]|jgi:hypothetical protein